MNSTNFMERCVIFIPKTKTKTITMILCMVLSFNPLKRHFHTHQCNVQHLCCIKVYFGSTKWKRACQCEREYKKINKVTGINNKETFVLLRFGVCIWKKCKHKGNLTKGFWCKNSFYDITRWYYAFDNPLRSVCLQTMHADWKY